MLGDQPIEQAPGLFGGGERLGRLAPIPVEIAHQVVSAGQAAPVVEDAGILPVEPVEDIHGPAEALQGRVQLAGHLLGDVQVAQVHRQAIRLVGQLGMLADDLLAKLDGFLIRLQRRLRSIGLRHQGLAQEAVDPGQGDPWVEGPGVFGGPSRLDRQRLLEGLDRLVRPALIDLDPPDGLEDQA